MLPRLATLSLLLLVPAAARAHAVEHEVERRGGAVYAVRARHVGGEPLVGASYGVIAPGTPERVHAEGRTDAQGWVVFVADAPGTWRIGIADATGHGRLVEVEVPAERGAPAAAPLAPLTAFARAEDGRPPPVPPAHPASEPSSRPLRTLAGAAALLLVFAAMRAVHRRRRRAR